MPIYGYECAKCHAAQEHIHKYEEAPPPCDECGAPPAQLVRQMSAPTCRFERSIGWDGWDRVGPGMVGRTVDPKKHIDDRAEQKNPGSRKAV